MTQAPVEIVPYDPSWPDGFTVERAELTPVLERWLAGTIEHIGSTAIPGMSAKAVIDLMAPVHTLDASRLAIGALAECGYCYSPYRPQFEHWFCKPSPEVRTHHLHLVPVNSAQWIDALAFRDYLRRHAEVAAAYDELKRNLAAQYRFDREGYTLAKAPFIAQVTAVARQ